MRASFQGLPGSVRRNPANFLRKKADVSTHTDVTVPTNSLRPMAFVTPTAVRQDRRRSFLRRITSLRFS